MIYFKLNVLRNTSHTGVLTCNLQIEMQIGLLVGARDKRPWIPSLWDNKGHDRWQQPGEWTTESNSRRLPTFWRRRCQCDGWTEQGGRRRQEGRAGLMPSGGSEGIKPRGFLGLRALQVFGRAPRWPCCGAIGCGYCNRKRRQPVGQGRGLRCLGSRSPASKPWFPVSSGAPGRALAAEAPLLVPGRARLPAASAQSRPAPCGALPASPPFRFRFALTRTGAAGNESGRGLRAAPGWVGPAAGASAGPGASAAARRYRRGGGAGGRAGSLRDRVPAARLLRPWPAALGDGSLGSSLLRAATPGVTAARRDMLTCRRVLFCRNRF